MKRKNFAGAERVCVALLTVMLAAAMLTGCGEGSRNSAARGDVSEYITEAGMSTEEGFAGGESMEMQSRADGNQADGQSRSDDRKLIKNVTMSVETKAFDDALSTIQKQAEISDGYIELMDTYNGSSYSAYNDSRQNRNASMTVRIPKDQLDTFLDTVSGVCNVISRSDSVEDITLTYVDLASHKKALETEQARLLELLERAESIEDVIAVEQRLSEVRYQIDSMESQLRTFDNKVDYSTVNLEIREVQELTPVAEETAWERISSGFLNSLKGLGHGLMELGIWFLVKLPYLLVWGIVIVGLIFLIVRLTKRSDKKRERKAQQALTRQALARQTNGADEQDLGKKV